jgi:hypothetical protein
MRQLTRCLAGLLLTAALTACSTRLPSPTALPAPSITIVPLASPEPPTSVPTDTLPPAPTATFAPTTAATATTAPSTPALTPTAGSPGATLPDYLYDRSTPSGLILSLFNAINRKEYLRAYSYWENPPTNSSIGTFDQFQQGYQATDSVQVSLGKISANAGAGQVYYSVPAVLKALTTSGQTQTFAGCYIVHLSQPAIQTAPPFHPLAVSSAAVKPADNAADPNGLLPGACPSEGGSPSPVPTTDPNTVAASNYLDDRSTAVQVLRSLFNAVNRKEYARAYAYWQNPGTANNVPPFAQFQQGYQNTASVEATFGALTDDIGAGQIRFYVPITLTVLTTDGKTQLFAGCYQLHLSQPAVQALPPFQPLGIERASVQGVAIGADTAGLAAAACAKLQ